MEVILVGIRGKNVGVEHKDEEITGAMWNVDNILSISMSIVLDLLSFPAKFMAVGRISLSLYFIHLCFCFK